jgi:hypothetical protein
VGIRRRSGYQQTLAARRTNTLGIKRNNSSRCMVATDRIWRYLVGEYCKFTIILINGYLSTGKSSRAVNFVCQYIGAVWAYFFNPSDPPLAALFDNRGIDVTHSILSLFSKLCRAQSN